MLQINTAVYLQISRNYKLFKQKNISSHKKIYKLVEIISYSNVRA